LASNYPITINGVVIKTPSTFKISHYNLTKSGRVASGKMTMELVAKKKKLFLTYSALSGADLKNILDLIDGTEMFFTVGFYDVTNQYRTITAYVGEIPMPLHRRTSIEDNTVWKDIDFNLIEQ